MEYSIELGEKPLLATIRTQHTDLCLTDVLHREVEPDSEAGVARIRPDEEVKLKLTDVVNTAKVPCRGSETAYISISIGSPQQTISVSQWIISSVFLTIDNSTNK